MTTPVYVFEAWSANGYRLADISKLCRNRSYTRQRNEAETLTFTLDVNALEELCRTRLSGVHPRQLINPYTTDVKVKRNGEYLFGTQVVDVDIELGASSYDATVTCTGYLNLLKDRYVTAIYSDVERTTIASSIIALTQAQARGSVGITIGAGQYVTGKLADRDYPLDNVKTRLQQLAALSDAPYDFVIDADKVWRTYAEAGSVRDDMMLVYGGQRSNVQALNIDRSALRVYNKIYGQGTGLGQVTLSSIQEDVPSQLNYFIREHIANFNSVKEQATLDQNTWTYLDLHSNLLGLPNLTITSATIPDGTFVTVGDRFPLAVNGHPFLDDVNGLYRVEKMDVSLDDNDFETVAITFDDYGVDQEQVGEPA